MSFLKRLFGADPEQRLERARKALDGGQPAEALDLFERVRDGAGDRADLVEQAVAGVAEASTALVELNLREADLSQEAGDLEGAMGHLETALDLCGDDGARSRITDRMKMMEDALAAEAEPQALFTTEGAVGEEDPPEVAWELLLGTLVDEVAEEYHERSAGYRDAVLALNSGSVEEAAAALEALRDEDPEDPLTRFELGRAYLSLERFADAAVELAAAREDIGFDPIDRAGLLQGGLLEADALLGDGKVREARALLDAAVEDQGENVSLMFLRGRIELAMDDHEAVEETFGRVTKLAPKMVEGAMMLGQSRLTRGDAAGAADVLESGIKRHCGSGTCQVQPVSAPAARMLVQCYLDQGTKLRDAEDLLLQIRGSQEGHIGWADHLLWGRLHEARGDAARMVESRQAALEAVPDEIPRARAEIVKYLGE